MKRDMLRQSRLERGWTQRKLAEKLDPPVDLRTIQRWERGDCLPVSYYRQQLCQIFQKNEQELELHTLPLTSSLEEICPPLSLPKQKIDFLPKEEVLGDLGKLALQFLVSAEKLVNKSLNEP